MSGQSLIFKLFMLLPQYPAMLIEYADSDCPVGTCHF